VGVRSRARREKLRFDWAAVPGNLEIMFGPFLALYRWAFLFFFFFLKKIFEKISIPI
jgi:hypothetical protein